MNNGSEVIDAMERLKREGRIKPNAPLIVRGLSVRIRVDGVLQPLAFLPRIAEQHQAAIE